MAFRSLRYSKVGKENIRAKPMPMRIWIRNTAFFLANLQLADWDTKGNRWICNLQIHHYNVMQFGTQMNELPHIK
jgi:hypothetical protein